MDRVLSDLVRNDLDTKMVLVTGPRQCGKTTLARSLFARHTYLNFDAVSDRLRLRKQDWDRGHDLVVFDELHKMSGWKRWLKGVYDTEGVRPRLLVTGSAQMDTYRKGGDSLAGRFFQWRLHPFDLKELKGEIDPVEGLQRLMSVGGFAEPFLKDSPTFYKRWRRSHLDVIIREDLRDLESIKEVQRIETLVELLRSRVGSPISYANLANDLEADAKTIKRWLAILERLYVVFPIRPFHRNVARSLLKEPKYYFYDTGSVIGDEGARFENVVACALLKNNQLREDQMGDRVSLHYCRTKDKREVDFAIAMDGKVTHLVECKWADASLTPALPHFGQFFPDAERIQVVGTLSSARKLPTGEQIAPAGRWLSTLPGL